MVPQPMADYAIPIYGNCPCRGAYQNRWVEVRLNVNGKILVLTNVPQGACPNCGSRVYKGDTLERIESIMKHTKIKKAMEPR